LPGLSYALPTLPSMFGDHPWALGLGEGLSAEFGVFDTQIFPDAIFFAARWEPFALAFARKGDELHTQYSFGKRMLPSMFGGVTLSQISGAGYTDFMTTFGLGYGFSRHLLMEFLVQDIVFRSADTHTMPRYEIALYMGAQHSPFTLRGFFSSKLREDGYTGDPNAFGAELFLRPLSGLELSVNLRRENEEYFAGAGMGIAFGDIFARAGVHRREGRNIVMTSATYGKHGRGDILAPKGSMLEFVVNGAMSETAQAGNSLLGVQGSLSFTSHLMALYRAAHDDNLKLVVLRLRDNSLGYARSEELMDALLALRRAGKDVLVVLEKGGLRNLLIASAASEIYLDPNIQFEISRPAMMATFYKGFLDKIGLEAQLFYRGPYKTAAQSYTEQTMSPEHRESATRILDFIGDRVLSLIAANRGIPAERIAGWVQAGLMTPEEALREGLVTHLGSYASVRRRVGRLDLQRHSVKHYLTLPEGFRSNDAIALISIEGTIVNGASSRRSLPFAGRSVGAETIIGALYQALQDSRVRGIIVRIDSGGGDGHASERIREAILLAAGIKPLVISMGDVAASGGLWIACGDENLKLDISAGASTLTGSIGVIAGKVSTEKLRSMLGIQSERIGDANTFLFDDSKGFTPEQQALVEKMLDYWYNKFVNIVAGGRRLSREEILKSAEGRVWTGGDAHARGLVDRNAGFIGAYTILMGRLRGNPLDYEYIELPQTHIDLVSLVTGVNSGSAPPIGLLPNQWTALTASLNDPDSWPGLFMSGRALALLPWNWEFE
jgi:protease-4